MKTAAMASLCILGLGAVIGFYMYFKKIRIKRVVTAFRVFTIFVFLAVWVLSVPVFEKYGLGGIVNAFHSTMGTFALETGMSDFMDICPERSVVIDVAVWLLFLIAPLATFGFVLSFFKNVSAWIRMHISLTSDIYFFSAMTRNTVNLASDINSRNENVRKLFVFFGVDREEMDSSTLIEEAEKMGAIVFSKDISKLSVWNWKKPFWTSGKHSLNWICASETEVEGVLDDAQNIDDALEIQEKFHELERRGKLNRNVIKDASLYVFASNSESELLFGTYHKAEEKSLLITMRKDPARSLVWNYVYENAAELLLKIAPEHGSFRKKCLNAVIIGLGREGLEMFHMLPWLLELKGWKLNLHVFDPDEKAESRLRGACPDLFLSPSEAEGVNYSISVYSGIEYETDRFNEILKGMKDISCVFVSLPDDNDTIAASMNVRKILGENHRGLPEITSVVKNLDDLTLLNTAGAYVKDGKWNIRFIGSSKDVWKEQLIKDSQLERDGRRINGIYEALSDEESYRKFRRSEYCYLSSCAAALSIHIQRGMDLPVVADDEFGAQEHMRWNTYMRSIGCSNGSDDGFEHIMEHRNIKPWKELPEPYREKELKITRKITGEYLISPVEKSKREVYAFLWENGRKLFDSALESDGDGIRVIKALISGAGSYGMSVLRALVWYTQVSGWMLDVTVHDPDSYAESDFREICPELMDEGHNGNRNPGEARYAIRFSQDPISPDPEATFLFISRDRFTLEMPSLDEIKDGYPKAVILGETCRERDSSDSRIFYLDEDAIYRNAKIMEKAGLERHKIYDDEESGFWNSGYNYSSSIASAMHIKLRKELGLPGADILPEERSLEEKRYIECMEHERWNAWERSEGWKFAPLRNNDRKEHNLLIPFEDLDEEQKAKDNI